RVASHDRVGRDVAADDRARAHHRAVSDPHPGEDHAAGSQPDIVADQNVAAAGWMSGEFPGRGPGFGKLREGEGRHPVRAVVAAQVNFDTFGDGAVLAYDEVGVLTPPADAGRAIGVLPDHDAA